MNSCLSNLPDIFSVLSWEVTWITFCQWVNIFLLIFVRSREWSFLRQTHSEKSTLPPSVAILQALERPPSSMEPWMRAASSPATIKPTWIVSVHSTAFMPPCTAYRGVTNNLQGIPLGKNARQTLWSYNIRHHATIPSSMNVFVMHFVCRSYKNLCLLPIIVPRLEPTSKKAATGRGHQPAAWATACDNNTK